MNITQNCALEILKVKEINVNQSNIDQVLNVLNTAYNEVYKAVAFDVDGTLTKKNSPNIDEEMSEIIGDLLKKGVHVLLISGRGRGSMRDAARQIIEKSHLSSSYIRRLSCIAHNGIYWLKSLSPNFSTLLQTEEIIVSQRLHLLKELRKEISNYIEFSDYFKDGSIRITDEPTIDPFLIRINYNQELYNVNNHLFFQFCENLKETIKNLYKENANNVFLTQAIYAGNYLFNISNTNKTIALNYYADRIGIHPNSILRVGDQGHYSGNDYELLDTMSGFSVGTISNVIDKCLPVINDECNKQLFGVEASRTLLNRVYLFPPLSLEPQYQPEQLKSLHEFEELAAKRSRNEVKMLTEKLRLRLHRLFDGKDSSFDHHSFRLSDLFDIHSGGILIRNYEVTKIEENNTLRKLFNLDDRIFFQKCEPNLSWAMFSDTNILLRGANYYWAMTNKEIISNNSDYFSNYCDTCINFMLKAKQSIDNVINENPNFISYKFVLGVADNVRNILLNYLYASYKTDSLMKGTNEWKNTMKICNWIRQHTRLLFDILLDENLTWRLLLCRYSELLKKLPSSLSKISPNISRYSNIVEKGLIRKWRETDFFFENVIAVNLGVHEFAEQINNKRNTKKATNQPVIGIGLVYGGSELPFIAEIVAEKKGIDLKGALLEISLYGNKKIRENVLTNNPLQNIEDYKNSLTNYVELSDQKNSFNCKQVILLDDNCTTCRTLEISRNILIKEGADVLGAIAVRFPATNRYAQMLFPKHGLPDPDILLSFIRGFVSPSPYSRIFEKQEEKGKEYLDKSGIFDKSKHRIVRYLTKNGNSVND